MSDNNQTPKLLIIKKITGVDIRRKILDIKLDDNWHIILINASEPQVKKSKLCKPINISEIANANIKNTLDFIPRKILM